MTKEHFFCEKLTEFYRHRVLNLGDGVRHSGLSPIKIEMKKLLQFDMIKNSLFRSGSRKSEFFHFSNVITTKTHRSNERENY